MKETGPKYGAFVELSLISSKTRELIKVPLLFVRIYYNYAIFYFYLN